jgi:hypothetical protein
VIESKRRGSESTREPQGEPATPPILRGLPGRDAGQKLQRETFKDALKAAARLRQTEAPAALVLGPREEALAIADASGRMLEISAGQWHPEDLLIAEFWQHMNGSDGSRRASDRRRRRAADRCRVCDAILRTDGPCAACGAEAVFARRAPRGAWWGLRKGTPRDLAIMLVLGDAVTRAQWATWEREEQTPETVLEILARRIKTRLGKRRAAFRTRRQEVIGSS